ncbi:hypothetical protein [uncultured Alsobacter sp.]|uniref:hypothetical protein n=1 Tax=uncultured Alsobacter sp. TaxID=1748258 RepID=UPI0025D23CC9|nr:hypothetical protein [uncultured Alsobacter sp.]
MEAFSLWLEFEEYEGGYPTPDDDPACDYCNVQIRVGAALYAANVWTFGCIERARAEAAIEQGLDRPADWLLAPDLLVSRLDRLTISAAVSDLMAHGGLPNHWLVSAGE